MPDKLEEPSDGQKIEVLVQVSDEKHIEVVRVFLLGVVCHFSLVGLNGFVVRAGVHSITIWAILNFECACQTDSSCQITHQNIWSSVYSCRLGQKSY